MNKEKEFAADNFVKQLLGQGGDKTLSHCASE